VKSSTSRSAGQAICSQRHAKRGSEGDQIARHGTSAGSILQPEKAVAEKRVHRKQVRARRQSSNGVGVIEIRGGEWSVLDEITAKRRGGRGGSDMEARGADERREWECSGLKPRPGVDLSHVRT
jgi:hypothetical protein